MQVRADATIIIVPVSLYCMIMYCIVMQCIVYTISSFILLLVNLYSNL